MRKTPLLLSLTATAAAALALGAARWRSATRTLHARLESGRLPIEPATYDARELDSLPAPVQRSFRAERENTIRAVTRRNLDKQGFDGLDDSAKAQQAWPLRFTPAVSVSLIVIGLALQSPWWLVGMALVALSGALLPGGMLIDTLYNIGVRHLFHAPPLPPTPKPRQFSYLISTAFLTASAVLFFAGLPVLGSVVGGLVAIAGTVLATTHWCLGSYYYRLIFRTRRHLHP